MIMHRVTIFRRSKLHLNNSIIRKMQSGPDHNSIPFAKAKVGTFFQAPPKLRNQYLQDVTLQRYLQRTVPPEILSQIEPDLTRFGQRVTEDIYEHGLDAENNPPKLRTFDAWGNRIDQVITTEGWRKLKDISAEEGVVAIAYERKFNEWSRLYQMVKLYLFEVSSSLYGCPIAMTDGAAKSLEVVNSSEFKYAFDRLTSRDPKQFWTSGQWMTERQGGSDVANGTETIAIRQSDNSYKLYGYKWFSSATDSDMALTLARIRSENGDITKGTKGISMFFLETKNATDGKLNNIQVMRLKEKLGTRQVPTGELLLDGTTARLVSLEGRGIASITSMLLITRMHNAISAVAAMRRITSMARDYAQSRVAFGNVIGKYPLHVKVLADMELETRGSTLLVLETSRLLGLDDVKSASEKDAHLLRLLTPLCKLFTAKKAMTIISEGLEAFGGQGYMEDTGLPRLLRDAQVTPIWEGTTNIISLDVLRAISKTSGQVVIAYKEDVLAKLERGSNNGELREAIAKVKSNLDAIEQFLKGHQDKLEVAARDFAFSLAEVYIGALLVEHASWSKATMADVFAAQRWSETKTSSVLDKVKLYSKESVGSEKAMVMEGFSKL